MTELTHSFRELVKCPWTDDCDVKTVLPDFNEETNNNVNVDINDKDNSGINNNNNIIMIKEMKTYLFWK